MTNYCSNHCESKSTLFITTQRETQICQRLDEGKCSANCGLFGDYTRRYMLRLSHEHFGPSLIFVQTLASKSDTSLYFQKKIIIYLFFGLLCLLSERISSL